MGGVKGLLSITRRPSQAAGPSKMCLSPAPIRGACPALPASAQTPATRKSSRDRQSRLPSVFAEDHELNLIRNHYPGIHEASDSTR